MSAAHTTSIAAAKRGRTPAVRKTAAEKNPRRRGKRSRRSRKRNPTGLAIAGIAIAATAIVGGYLYVRQRRRKTQSQIPSKDGPTGVEVTLATYKSPYAIGRAYRTAQGDYRFTVEIPKSDPTMIDRSVNTEAEARSEAELYTTWFGEPRASDDIIVELVGSVENPFRGAVWQSVTDGGFYWRALYPNGTTWNTDTVPGIDQAIAAIKSKLTEQRDLD